MYSQYATVANRGTLVYFGMSTNMFDGNSLTSGLLERLEYYTKAATCERQQDC